MEKKEVKISLGIFVIGIIVLLILVGIVINKLYGNQEIVGKTQTGVSKYEKAQINFINAEEYIGDYIDLGTNLITKTETIKADWRIFEVDET